MAESISMRYKWRELVNRDPRLTHAQLRVLYELESHANADGTEARPPIAKIARNLRTQTEAGHMSEKTVSRALAVGVELGYIELTTKGRRGRSRNSANVYCLTIPAGLPDTQVSSSQEGVGDTQVSGNQDVTTGHSGATTGHFESTTGHFGATNGHLDVPLPVPSTNPFTSDPSHQGGASLTFRNADAPAREDTDPLAFVVDGLFKRQPFPASQERAQDDVIDAELVATPPAPLPEQKPEDPASVLAWCIRALGRATDSEQERIKELIDEGTATKHGIVRTIRDARTPSDIRRLKART